MMENKFKVAILLREVYRIEKIMDSDIYNTDEYKIYELIEEIGRNIDEELLTNQLELVSNILYN